MGKEEIRIPLPAAAAGWWTRGWQAEACSRRRRARRWAMALAVCFSPVLIPLICLSFPVLCIIFLFVWIRPDERYEGGAMSVGDFEPAVEAGRLLQRYLEDQIELVRSAFDGGDGGDGGEGCGSGEWCW